MINTARLKKFINQRETATVPRERVDATVGLVRELLPIARHLIDVYDKACTATDAQTLTDPAARRTYEPAVWRAVDESRKATTP